MPDELLTAVFAAAERNRRLLLRRWVPWTIVELRRQSPRVPMAYCRRCFLAALVPWMASVPSLTVAAVGGGPIAALGNTEEIDADAFAVRTSVDGHAVVVNVALAHSLRDVVVQVAAGVAHMGSVVVDGIALMGCVALGGFAVVVDEVANNTKSRFGPCLLRKRLRFPE
jgi:hypothetical protein